MMCDGDTIDTPAGRAILRRSRRKTLAISVLPDGSLELTAPLCSELPAILARVEKRTGWIRRQRLAFSEMNDRRPEPRFVTGATHRYLGRQYRLKISTGSRPAVALRGGWFHVSTASGSPAEVETTLNDWLRQQARRQFERRLSLWRDWCLHRSLPAPRLRLRHMPKRWGSALRNGTIQLNPELVKAPSSCIDYVITHEICHLQHPDHGPGFQSLLQRLCPDWKVLKARLETFGA